MDQRIKGTGPVRWRICHCRHFPRGGGCKKKTCYSATGKNHSVGENTIFCYTGKLRHRSFSLHRPCSQAGTRLVSRSRFLEIPWRGDPHLFGGCHYPGYQDETDWNIAGRYAFSMGCNTAHTKGHCYSHRRQGQRVIECI